MWCDMLGLTPLQERAYCIGNLFRFGQRRHMPASLQNLNLGVRQCSRQGSAGLEWNNLVHVTVDYENTRTGWVIRFNSGATSVTEPTIRRAMAALASALIKILRPHALMCSESGSGMQS